jgi:hypothetical protein
LITEIEEHQEEDVDVDVDDDIDENNNNVPETNNYNEEIVDEQTNPYESERFFSEITSKLPPATTALKHQYNATTFRQAADVGKQHKQSKLLINGDTCSLIQGQHENEVPIYMELVDLILNNHKFEFY